MRDIDPAKLLDRMIDDLFMENGLAGLRKGPERGWHVGADRLTFRVGCVSNTATLELRLHVRVCNCFRVDIADALFLHVESPSQRGWSSVLILFDI
jgi:hypothetical protein